MPHARWLLIAADLLAGDGCTQSAIERKSDTVSSEDVRRGAEKAVILGSAAVSRAKEELAGREKVLRDFFQV